MQHEQQIPVAVTIGPAPSVAAAKRVSILVVDDDPDIAELIETFLQSEGYVVSVAHNGQEALTAVEDLPPNLIFLDMRMPVMDGWQFSHELKRRQPQRPPIVVITAAEDAASRAAEIQADGHLGKPFNLIDLQAAARRFTHAA